MTMKLKCLWCEVLQKMREEDLGSEDFFSRTSLTAVYNTKHSTNTLDDVSLVKVIEIKAFDDNKIEVDSHVIPHLEDFIVITYECEYDQWHINTLEIKGTTVDYYIDSDWLDIKRNFDGDITKEEYLELKKVSKLDPSNIIDEVKRDGLGQIEDAEDEWGDY